MSYFNFEYRSPIDIIFNNPMENLRMEINKRTDEVIYKAILDVGVEVDKDELIRALNYDRKQYEKGYEAGKMDATVHAHWIKRSNPNHSPFDSSAEYNMICSNCGGDHERFYHYCPDCGAKMDREVQ